MDRCLEGKRVSLQSAFSAYGDALFFRKGEICRLPYGDDDRVRIHGGQICFIIPGIKGAIFVKHVSTPFEFDPRELTVLFQEPLGSQAVDNANFLLECLLNLVIPCRHFISFFKAD